MPEINQIIEALVKFRDERNWEQFHNTKDLWMAISIEVITRIQNSTSLSFRT